MAQHPHQIRIQRSARKSIERLATDVRLRVEDAIMRLALNPRPPGMKALKGGDEYRIRVGNYRIIYVVNNDEELLILIVSAGHREDVYRDL